MSNETIEANIDDLIGPPVDISKISKKSINKIAFDLYRETLSLVTAVISICRDEKVTTFSRNQAIEVGFLVRISKFMASVMALTADKVKAHGEVIMALNRCISESSIKLIYFSEKASGGDCNTFIKSGLKPEKEMYEMIQKNISDRGNQLPIEKRMLKFIDNTIKASGFSNIADLNDIPRWKDFKTILRNIDLEDWYTFIQQIPSHSIHGNWPDLVLHHLKYKDNEFMPKLDSITPDTRLFLPISMIVLRALKLYINKNYLDFDKNHPIINRVRDLMERIEKVEVIHEVDMSKQ